jgi:hypothetical protein
MLEGFSLTPGRVGTVLAYMGGEEMQKMVDFVVDGETKTVDSGLKTWGNLLDELDVDAAGERRTVTEVRFDGVDEPSFRRADLLATKLTDLGAIEIETVDRIQLLRATLGQAGSSLPILAASACRAANAFRRDDLTSANEQLSSLVEAVRTLTILTVASATAAGTELEDLACGVGSGADVLGGVGLVLDTMSQWQTGRDWPAVADVLENDLAPAILQWGVVFDAMHERCDA